MLCSAFAGFSYCFKRYDNYTDDDIKIDDFIRSKEVLDLLNNITGLEVTNTVSFFASCYSGDSFLSTHTDKGRGKIAVVLNLTKNWNINNGGNFELLDNDWLTVKKIINPKFNSLTLFDVRGNGVPHRVTRVNSNVVDKRLSFSGWLV